MVQNHAVILVSVCFCLPPRKILPSLPNLEPKNPKKTENVEVYLLREYAFEG